MRKTIAKALTWRLIGTAEIFAISFWTTGHIADATPPTMVVQTMFFHFESATAAMPAGSKPTT